MSHSNRFSTHWVLKAICPSDHQCGGLGYAILAPGTFGSLGAMPFWWLRSSLTYSLCLLTLGVIGLSIWASNHADVIYGEHDLAKLWSMNCWDPGNWILNSSDLAVGYRSLYCLSPLRHLEATSYRQIDRSLGEVLASFLMM